MSNKYTRALRNVMLLKEAIGDEDDFTMPDADIDRDALGRGIDRTGTPDQYDVQGPEVSASDTAKKVKELTIKWAQRINEFADWLNDTNGKSLLSLLQKVDEKPGFAGLGKETRREIPKTAAALKSLVQKLNGYINTVDAKIREEKK